MEQKKNSADYRFRIIMLLLLMVQLAAAAFFCVQKKGFHYDEYYSYYSSNVTYGLVPRDLEWKSTEEIKSEFSVVQDARFSYEMVNLMQSYDVHPPLYYFLLHTVCSFTPGIFSKWQGLSINLFFFALTWLLLGKIAADMSHQNKKAVFTVCLLFGFSPGVYSGITFIRMYMMLTFFCMAVLYVHIRALIRGKRTILNFYLPVAVLSFLGFYTHYYFIVFLFFIGLWTFVSMLAKKENRRQAPCYAASVMIGMLGTVMAYPVCLSHIFRGYRGTEAMDAFFDVTNASERLSFFLSLVNEYVLCNFFFMAVLILLVLGVTVRYLHTRKKSQPAGDARIKTGQSKDMQEERSCMYLTAFVMTGYFLVVAKTALLNAEEAIRYELPVYGLIILLVVLLLSALLNQLQTPKTEKLVKWSFAGFAAAALILQCLGLANNGVLFLYPEDEENTAWAAAHETEPVVYIYNTANQWMIWDDSEELMKYDEIYFMSMEHTSFTEDDRLMETDHIYVYAARSDQSSQILEELIRQNPNLTKQTKIRELRYCDLYQLE